jgi:hypothetical protein
MPRPCLSPGLYGSPQPEVMQPFLVSSDTNFFYHPSTYSNSLEALVFGVILTFFDDLKTFLTLLAIAGNVLYQTQLNSAGSS